MQIYQQNQQDFGQYENVTTKESFVKARRDYENLYEILHAICKAWDGHTSLYIVMEKTEEEYLRNLFRTTTMRIFPKQLVEQSTRKMVAQAMDLILNDIQHTRKDVTIIKAWLSWPCEKKYSSNVALLTVALQRKPERK